MTFRNLCRSSARENTAGDCHVCAILTTKLIAYPVCDGYLLRTYGRILIRKKVGV